MSSDEEIEFLGDGFTKDIITLLSGNRHLSVPARASALAPEGGFAPAHDWYRGLADFVAGEYAAAMPRLRRKAQEQPDYGFANVLCALCEDAFGNGDNARKFIARAKEHNPQLRPEKLAGIFLSQSDGEKGRWEYAALQRLWAAG